MEYFKSVFKYNQKGITLISLVITIIVLIILATVSINMVVGENGLIKRTEKVAESYKITSEREYLELNVLSVQLDNYVENVSTEKLGETLNTRNLDNSLNWHIIKVNDKSYETGWNYVEKGTELPDYGKTEYNWLINYETGEIIQLEENNYISLSAGDMLAVKDSLIINVDSSIVDENVANNEDSLEKQLGENVELVNFEYTENSGLTSTSFNFDGVNDYIKVKYDKKEQKEALANRGFTFEFYGIWDGGTTSHNESSAHKGIFCYWNGEESKQAQFRFGINEEWKEISWNASTAPKELSDFSQTKSTAHNILYPIDLEKLKNGIYITVTLDTSSSYKVSNGIFKPRADEYFPKIDYDTITKEGEYYKQTVYVNGNVLYEGDYNKKNWNYFITNELENLKYFCIGRSSMGNDGWWHYSKMNAYCLRLYSRALTEDEVNKNYEKSVQYHSLIESK